MEFILASSSPRRKELLNLIGIQPQIISPNIDESRLAGESVETFLKRVTITKGESVYGSRFHNSPIISADTVVLCDDRLIGKPVDREEAFQFLTLLSNNRHEVRTGLAIHYKGKSCYKTARTAVVFSLVTENEIQHYLDVEHYMDKAGAYAIQGRASVFVERIEGCYFNVMGFPLNLFYSMLKELEISLI